MFNYSLLGSALSVLVFVFLISLILRRFGHSGKGKWLFLISWVWIVDFVFSLSTFQMILASIFVLIFMSFIWEELIEFRKDVDKRSTNEAKAYIKKNIYTGKVYEVREIIEGVGALYLDDVRWAVKIIDLNGFRNKKNYKNRPLVKIVGSLQESQKNVLYGVVRRYERCYSFLGSVNFSHRLVDGTLLLIYLYFRFFLLNKYCLAFAAFYYFLPSIPYVEMTAGIAASIAVSIGLWWLGWFWFLWLEYSSFKLLTQHPEEKTFDGSYSWIKFPSLKTPWPDFPKLVRVDEFYEEFNEFLCSTRRSFDKQTLVQVVNEKFPDYPELKEIWPFGDALFYFPDEYTMEKYNELEDKLMKAVYRREKKKTWQSVVFSIFYLLLMFIPRAAWALSGGLLGYLFFRILSIFDNLRFLKVFRIKE